MKVGANDFYDDALRWDVARWGAKMGGAIAEPHTCSRPDGSRRMG